MRARHLASVSSASFRISLSPGEVARDFALAQIDGSSDFRDHPSPNHEVYDAKNDGQPEELGDEDFRKLVDLRHWWRALAALAD